MEEALSKIRVHTSSSLLHQKRPATLLVALESTFEEQNTEKSPTAYFAALLTTLESTLQRKDVGLAEADILPAVLYLLALVMPYVPQPVIRSHLSTLISLTAPLFPALEDESVAGPLKSQLTIYDSIFHALDRPHLESQGTRQSFASILQLCIDRRPKVRRKAADVVKDILESPPPPLVTHPYAERVAQWVQDGLSSVSSKMFQKSKSSGTENPAVTVAIHIITFSRPIVTLLPPSTLPEIVNLVLALPRLGNPYLSRSAYSIVSDIFAVPSDDPTSPLASHIASILSTVLSSPPDKSDTEISPAWIQVVGHAVHAQTDIDSDQLGKVWKVLWGYLESTVSPTRKATGESLSILVQSAVASQNEAIVKKWVGQVIKSFDMIAFLRAIPELLVVASSLFFSVKSVAVVEDLITKVGDLRTQKGFEYKEGADACLAAAMRAFGPEHLLRILPLNLEPADRAAGREPRAYLLPLLTQPHSTSVKHFVTYFVPLSERMFDLQQKAENEGRQSEAKVWSVLLSQVWAGLPSYNWACLDLNEALSSQFSQLLSQLLYTQTELRPPILKALKVVIESNLDLTIEKSVSEKSITPAQAEANIAFLGSQAESWLAVLFNVFGTVKRDSRNAIGEVITAWASVSNGTEISNAYQKVIQLFKQNLGKASPVAGDDEGSVAAMTQDILILIIPYISNESAQALFQLSLSPQVLSGKDSGVQKRGYKILTKLLENKKVEVDVETTLKRLDELSGGLVPAAKKDRFSLLAELVPLLPPTMMHVIPTLIPEAVLGTKETSEKARNAAFDLVLVMGRKMSQGGLVQRDKLEGMDQDDNEGVSVNAQASVEEYMTMIAGGLAGATPHMISATVTAISRLVFEFKDAISALMHNEILSTLEVFLTSNNREIVKSVLGYVKLSIHTLSLDILRPHLAQLVPALLKWSHDHKNHFKSKVRHIFERMLRRFSWDEVYSCAGEEEAAKVLVNIKKRKDRAKRKKAAKEEDEDEDEEVPAKKGGVDAFEDVLYGSESELDDSEDELAPNRKAGTRRGKADTGARLRMDADEPLDLLEGAGTFVTNLKSNKRRKPGQDAAHFKTDEDSGKMIIDEEESEAEADVIPRDEDVAGTAYRESISGVDGFTRGPNGRIKFNKDTAKRRRETEEMDMEDVDMDASTKRKAKKKTEIKLGHEFKAKRAGGDVKKGGMDPYAYISLSQAAKRGKAGKGRIGISGKR